jgi:pyruvate dehydrogenase E1 component alpha subunit
VTPIATGWTFDDTTICLLTPEGERIAHPSYPDDATGEQCQAMYRDMVLARRLDAEATALQRQGELGMWIPSLGQEAAHVGAAHALGPADHVFPAYRQHGMVLCQGVDPLDLLRLFRGVSNSGWDGERHRIHPYTIVVGAQALHATGYAMGMGLDGADAAVVACFGDGASSQGDVSEALTFASVFSAPVVFFCENNQWAISVPVERQAQTPLYRRAAGFGFPGVRVDGNDVLACRAVVRAALAHARSGNGPVFIEAVTYRMGPHTTSDDPSRYRDPAEVALWRARDPIDRLAAYLREQGLAGDEFQAAVARDADALATRVREGVPAITDPRTEDIFQYAYAAPHPLVEEERAELLTYLAGFEEGG